MPSLIINGVHIYYEEKGNGEPLIFLHGLGMDLLAHQHEIEGLAAAFHVIAMDLRGHGRSDKPLNYTLQNHIDDVIALMDYLQIKKASLLGCSMGSYIAQGVAIAVPERIEKLILVAAKSNGKTSSTARLLAEHAEETAGLDLQEKIQFLSKYMFHQLDRVGVWMNEVHQTAPLLTEEQQAAANKALEGFDFRSELNRITARTLVIGGIYDGLNPPEEGKIIASLIPSAVFVAFDQSGHAPNIEEPERFIETINTFLNTSTPMDAVKLIDIYRERLNRCSPEQLSYRSGNIAWSLGQMYDHVIEVSREYLVNAEACMNSGTMQPQGKTEAGEILFSLGGFPPVKIKLPDELDSPAMLRKEDLVDGLNEIRRLVIEWQGKVEAADPCAKVKHDGFGWLNAKEWLELVEMHFRHHLRQQSGLERQAGITPVHISSSSLQSSIN